MRRVFIVAIYVPFCVCHKHAHFMAFCSHPSCLCLSIAEQGQVEETAAGDGACENKVRRLRLVSHHAIGVVDLVIALATYFATFVMGLLQYAFA